MDDTMGDEALAKSLAGKRVSARNLAKKGKQFKKQAALAKIRAVCVYLFGIDIYLMLAIPKTLTIILFNIFNLVRIVRISKQQWRKNLTVTSIMVEILMIQMTTMKRVSNRGSKRGRRNHCPRVQTTSRWAWKMSSRHLQDLPKSRGRRTLRLNWRITTRFPSLDVG